MAIVLDGTSGITNDSGYTGDGVSFADSTPANTLVTTSGGNVGIGTSSPGAKLQVNTNTSKFIRVTDGDHTTFGSQMSAITFSRTDGAAAMASVFGVLDQSLAVAARDNVIFATGGDNSYRQTTERARIDSSGNLLVGTTSVIPGYLNTNTGVALSPNATSSFSRGGGDYTMTVNSNNTGTRFLIAFRSGGVGVGSIDSNGTTTTYGTTSDYRLKHDIQPMTGALAKVQQLKPVTYKWKSTGMQDEGFIAHELQEVCPSAVTGEKDAVDAEGNPQYQGIDTSFLVATLTAAIQEQQAIITALTARVEALEGAQA